VKRPSGTQRIDLRGDDATALTWWPTTRPDSAGAGVPKPQSARRHPSLTTRAVQITAIR
jgi:hypothetical protein